MGSPGSARRECRWDDGCVITADDVETLLFDVLGTVVDEAGSMRAELAAALDQAGAGRQAEALAAAWARRLAALVSSIGEGAPWRSAHIMIAAHPWDLRAAAAHGLRTAYIQRAGEGAPEPSDTFDLTVPDLAALAARLLTEA